MPITIPTRAELSTAIKSFFTARFPGRNLGTEGFLGKTWRAVAMALWSLTKAVQDADRDATPTTKTSSSGLDNWGEVLGLPNGGGGFGRRGARAATGGTVTATGTNGTVIANGTQAVGSDGVTLFQAVDGPYTIAAGTAVVSMDAITAGIAGNLEVGEVVTWISPPAGLAASAAVASSFSGGQEVESDASLLARIQFRLQNPPKGGTAPDYREWCENAVDVTTGELLEINRAYVFPRRSGTGSVDVVVTQSGTGQSRRPAVATIEAVQAYLDSVRPVAVEGSTVLRPYMPNGAGLVIRCRMVPAVAEYGFDWDDLMEAYPTIKSLPSATTIEINGAAPAALLAAVSAGKKPRIQVAATGVGAPVKAKTVRVTAINTTPADDILTIDSTLSGAVSGNVIYAGAPGVEDTQKLLLDYVDSLGPGRSSGFANPDDPWETTCAIARLSQTALDAMGGDGRAYWANVVSGGVTIDGSATDVTPTDTVYNGPQILYAGRILVTQ